MDPMRSKTAAPVSPGARNGSRKMIGDCMGPSALWYLYTIYQIVSNVSSHESVILSLGVLGDTAAFIKSEAGIKGSLVRTPELPAFAEKKTASGPECHYLGSVSY